MGAKLSAKEWEANAIAKCWQNAELVKQELDGELCIACMMPHPCHCDMDITMKKMRVYYEENRRSLFRREPVLNMSWGQKGDGLMFELYQIASEPFKKEISRLQRKLSGVTNE